METNSKNAFLNVILVLIAVGIWAIVLQNAGILSTNQQVRVKGGTVVVSGKVDATIKDTVGVDIKKVSVKNAVVKRSPNLHASMPSLDPW